MFKAIKPWTLPPAYFGAVWPDYYVIYGWHRDSDSVTRSNARVLCAAFPETGEYDPDDPNSGVVIVRERHFLVGWVEWLGIHKSRLEDLRRADDMIARLDAYPVLSEEDWSELEWSEACEYWKRMSVAERVEWLQRAELSIFAARRSELPNDPAGRLFELLTQP